MTIKDQKQLSDEKLVKLLQQGQFHAMAGLYARYYLVVFNKCLSFVKNTDDASDLTQDIMLKVMERIASFKGESKFSTWLYAITYNYCTDFVRKQKKLSNQPYGGMIDYIFSFSSEHEDAQINETKIRNAERALQLISTDEQELLRQKYQLNKTISELQKTYNLSASAVKMRLMRAREKADITYAKLEERAA
jgi:RNA polymerase sigma factor (sigma-70 family)